VSGFCGKKKDNNVLFLETVLYLIKSVNIKN